MLPKMRFALVHNIGCSNGVLSLGVSPSLKVAAAVWLISRTGTVACARAECLKFAVERFLDHYPNWQLWLVAGHRAVQPDNRITRHFGLWNSLKKRGTSIPTGEYITEVVVPCERGMRCFGAVRFTPDQMDTVCSVLSAESATIVAFDSLHSPNFINELVVRGWSPNSTRPPEEILERVCSAGGAVIGFFGEFDDVEGAAAVMGNIDLVAGLND